LSEHYLPAVLKMQLKIPIGLATISYPLLNPFERISQAVGASVIQQQVAIAAE
jgi:hypothetical protein